MKRYGFNEITLMQYITIIHGGQVGVGLLTLPREMAKTAGTDGWMAIVLGWAIAVITSLCIVAVMRRYPDDTILDLVRRLFGKWACRAAAVIWLAYFVAAFAAVLATSVSITKVWVLSQTPAYMMVLLFLLPTVMVARSGIRILGRYAELVFYCSLAAPFFLIAPLKESHLVHILPLIKGEWSGVLQAVKLTAPSFLGFEVGFFLYPFLLRKERAYTGVVIANTLSMIVFMLVLFSSNLFYSPDQITEFTWPTLSLLKVIEFHFLERFDIVFLAFYLFLLSTTWTPLLMLAGHCASRLTGQADHAPHVYAIAGTVFAVSVFYFPAVQELRLMEQLWSRSGLVLAYATPFALLLVLAVTNLIRKNRRTEGRECG
jgi:spore germination protein (amino acid permease)